MNRLLCFRLTILVVCLAAVGYGQEVIDSVDVGGWNASSLVYNSRAGVVYGRCYYGDNFFAIACSTNELVAQIPLVYPIATAYASTLNRAYCTFSYHGEDSVLVVDGSTHARIKAVRVDGAYLPVWDSVSNRLYITCFDYDEVAVFDCATDSVLSRISVPGEPVGLSINTRRRKLYVQNDYDMTVSVIDMETNSIIRNVYVGSWHFAACYSAAADKYYCDGAAGVTVIDGAGDTLIKQIALPPGYGVQAMIAVDAESLVMVAAYSGGADSVFVVDVNRNSIVSALRVGSSPKALAYSPTTHFVYCANSGWDNLSVIAADGSSIVKTLAVGNYPQALLVCAEFGRLYVGHAREWVYVIRDRIGGVREVESHPEQHVVLRAFPNPFTTRARIECELQTAGVQVAVYSQTGQIVRRLDSESARPTSFIWDGNDEAGRSASAGVYFAVAEGATGGRVRLVKLR